MEGHGMDGNGLQGNGMEQREGEGKEEKEREGSDVGETQANERQTTLHSLFKSALLPIIHRSSGGRQPRSRVLITCFVVGDCGVPFRTCQPRQRQMASAARPQRHPLSQP